MNINILVMGGVCESASALSAVRFCRAATEAGHTITQVFFYREGVGQSNAHIEPLADEFNAYSEWQSFSTETGCSLVVCISAAERRGLVESDEDSGYTHGLFQVEGLGSFHAACLEADRTVTFK